MQYYNLNIKYKNQSQSQKWLNERKRAPIFFGKTRIDELLTETEASLAKKYSHADLKGFSKKQIREARLFCEIGRNRSAWKNTILVTIDCGLIWVYSPSGNIQEEEADEKVYTNKDNIKSFPISLRECKKIRDVPLVLASMKANQSFSRSTFKKIENETYPGNILAIQHILGDTITLPEKVSPLDCLSSIELETLVAKIFEANSCFVPAYKGGLLPGIDLVIKYVGNDDSLDLDGLRLLRGETKSIQVKLNFNKNKNSEADFNIGYDLRNTERSFGKAWIWGQVWKCPPVLDWLKCSLHWLPPDAWKNC